MLRINFKSRILKVQENDQKRKCLNIRFYTLPRNSGKTKLFGKIAPKYRKLCLQMYCKEDSQFENNKEELRFGPEML